MVGIIDVAKKSGVSIATVSRVINKNKNVSAETAKIVTDAINELNYVPNRVASSLRSAETKTIGLVIGDITNPFYGQIAKGAENFLEKYEYSLLVVNTDYSIEKERIQIKKLLEKQVDAILIASKEESPWDNLLQLSKGDIPMALIDTPVSKVPVDQILIDSFETSYKATYELIANGHRKIAIILGKPQYEGTQAKLDGYKRALNDYKINIDNNLIFYGEYSIQDGIKIGNNLIDLDLNPTAIFCTNNLMTQGILHSLKKKEIHIPKDVSLIGIDDMDWYNLLEYPLTTISQPAFDMGGIAAERVLSRIRNKEVNTNPKKIILPTKLIIRNSIKKL